MKLKKKNLKNLLYYAMATALLWPPPSSGGPLEKEQGEPSKLIYYGSCLAFETFSVILDQVSNENVYPAVHVYLAFI